MEYITTRSVHSVERGSDGDGCLWGRVQSSLVLSRLHVYHPVMHVNYYVGLTLSPYQLRFRRSVVDYLFFLPSFQVWDMCAVVVSKQSCKHGNHPIQGGHRTTPRFFFLCGVVR
jgi:hypothetical protein